MRTLGLFLLVLAPAALNAQTSKAQITGTVQDASQAAIPGAKVTVANTQTGIRRGSTANELAVYTVPLLEPGDYTMTVGSQGFQTFPTATSPKPPPLSLLIRGTAMRPPSALRRAGRTPRSRRPRRNSGPGKPA
jgi:hypothetical protein